MACIGGLFDTMTGSVILTANEVKEVESYIDQLNTENAKLRELVRDDLRPKYDHTLRMTPVEWQEYDDNILRRAHKLGVEVD